MWRTAQVYIVESLLYNGHTYFLGIEDTKKQHIQNLMYLGISYLLKEKYNLYLTLIFSQ